jgi:TRAP-type transport system periplasmic protein
VLSSGLAAERHEDAHAQYGRAAACCVGRCATAALAACGILARPGNAAEFNFKYANNDVTAHPMNVRLRQAVERIGEETGGRMDIQLFPNSQLGGDTAMRCRNCTLAAIQMLDMSGLILSTYVPIASIRRRAHRSNRP